MDAHVLHGEVLDRHVRRAAHAEPARLHVEFDGFEALAGIPLAAEIQLAGAVLVVVVPEVQVAVEVAVGVERPAGELVELRARLLVGADHDLDRVRGAAVEHERAHVVVADRVRPHARVVGAFPFGGVGAVLRRPVDGGLRTLAVRGVGDAGLGVHAAAVEAAAREEHVRAGRELLPVQARNRLPGRLRRRAVRGVIALLREEPLRRVHRHSAVRRGADLGDSRVGLRPQGREHLFGALRAVRADCRHRHQADDCHVLLHVIFSSFIAEHRQLYQISRPWWDSASSVGGEMW